MSATVPLLTNLPRSCHIPIILNLDYLFGVSTEGGASENTVAAGFALVLTTRCTAQASKHPEPDRMSAISRSGLGRFEPLPSPAQEMAQP
jgi:hypothetical protein